MRSFLKRSNVVIERVSPEVDGGRYRAKAIVGDSILVSADIFRDGAHVLQAAIRHRGPSDQEWSESTMSPGENHHWQGTFQPTEIGRHKYTIEAWTDAFGTWRRDLRLRVEADQNVDMELEEGSLLLESRLELIPPGERSVVQ